MIILGWLIGPIIVTILILSIVLYAIRNKGTGSHDFTRPSDSQLITTYKEMFVLHYLKILS